MKVIGQKVFTGSCMITHKSLFILILNTDTILLEFTKTGGIASVVGNTDIFPIEYHIMIDIL